MSELATAIKQICEEKGLAYEAVIGTIESALSAAYRKDFGKKNQNVKVEFDPETGKSKVFDMKLVVEDMPEEEEEETADDSKEEVKKIEEDKGDKKILKDKKKDEKKTDKKKDDEEASQVEEEEVRKFNPKTEMQISDARMIKKTVKLGEELKMKLDPPDEYGRMAAQTAKQVIIQRLREAEREMVFNDFKEKEHEVVSGVVQRREGKIVLIDLGKAVGVLPPDEMIQGENYNPGDRIKVYVREVAAKSKGPEIVLSRTSDEILKKVFYLEIPEISNGLIEIKNVAREAGFRSKVAVWTDSDNVDPIGSCVGQRGARIQTIINELGGEKVDIIQYDEDPIAYITNALSPAKIIGIDTEEEGRKARVKVSEDQLSLAIGKGGQNARLAAKLTGWKIDIVDAGKEAKEGSQKTPQPSTLQKGGQAGQALEKDAEGTEKKDIAEDIGKNEDAEDKKKKDKKSKDKEDPSTGTGQGKKETKKEKPKPKTKDNENDKKGGKESSSAKASEDKDKKED